MIEPVHINAGLALAAQFRARRLDIGTAAARDQLRRSPVAIREEAVALRADASRLDELAEDVEAALAREAEATPVVTPEG